MCSLNNVIFEFEDTLFHWKWTRKEFPWNSRAKLMYKMLIWNLKHLLCVMLCKWLKKFRSACINLNDQGRSGTPKSVDSLAVLQAIDANLVSSALKVSIRRGWHRTALFGCSTSRAAKLQNFWLTRVQIKCCRKTFWKNHRVHCGDRG